MQPVELNLFNSVQYIQEEFLKDSLAVAVSQVLQHIIRISPSHLQLTVIVKSSDLRTHFWLLSGSALCKGKTQELN